jgi:branched-chain amino acid transport system ATP-binding protein
MTVILETQNLSKFFGGLRAVDDVSLSFEEESITAIIGPNGAGKTTFINLCTGLLKPNTGKIIFNGEDITHLPPHKRVLMGISRTFQISNIFPGLTVAQNIRIPLLSRGDKALSELEELMKVFEFEDIKDALASEISHGDQRLLEMAMAIATKPRILFLDEPTAGVNPAEKHRILEIVMRLKETEKLTIVIVEHDMDVVFKMAERIVVMNRGRILADRTPEEIKDDKAVREVYLKGVEI